MRKVVIAAMLVGALVGCQNKEQQDRKRMELAMDLIHRQVASDIRVILDGRNMQVFRDTDGRNVVCGEAVLDRRSDDARMALNNAHQKFVAVFKDDGAGMATFDGSKNPEGRQRFADLWNEKCH